MTIPSAISRSGEIGSSYSPITSSVSDEDDLKSDEEISQSSTGNETNDLSCLKGNDQVSFQLVPMAPRLSYNTGHGVFAFKSLIDRRKRISNEKADDI